MLAVIFLVVVPTLLSYSTSCYARKTEYDSAPPLQIIDALSEKKVFKFSTKAADQLKCIGMIMKPLEVEGDGPRIFYVNCETKVLCGYRGNPYKTSCVVDFTQDEMGYYKCLSEAATNAALTACSHRRIRCQKKCPDVYFDLWEESDSAKQLITVKSAKSMAEKRIPNWEEIHTSESVHNGSTMYTDQI